jgi:HK97 family phage portal protein
MGLAARLAGALTGAREGWAQRQRGPYNDGWLAVQPGWHVPTETGELITAGRTLENPTINACVYLLANTLGAEEWSVIQDREGSGHIIDTQSAEARALAGLGFEQRQGYVADLFTYGNAFLLKHYAGSGEIGALERLLASNMAIMASADGRVGFRYFDPWSGTTIDIPSERIIHAKCRVVKSWPWTGVPPALQGVDAAGIAFALQRYKLSALSRAPMLWGVLKTANKLDKAKSEHIREQWQSLFAGGPSAGKTAILEQGLEFQPLSIANFEAMALEAASRVTSLDLCRFFGIPPSMTGEFSSVNRSTSQVELEVFFRTCLYPNSICVLDPVTRGLIAPSRQLARYRVGMDLDKWILGSGTSLADVASKMAGGPWASVDEARRLFGLAPFRDELGADLLAPVNMYAKGNAPPPAGVVAPSPPGQDSASAPAAPDNPDPLLARLAEELVTLRGLVEESLRRRPAPKVTSTAAAVFTRPEIELPPMPEPPTDDFEEAVAKFMALNPSGEETDAFLARRVALAEERRQAHMAELERWDAQCAALSPPDEDIVNQGQIEPAEPVGAFPQVSSASDGVAAEVFSRLAVELLTARTGEIAKDEIAGTTRNIVGALRREMAADRELRAIETARSEASETVELETFRQQLRRARVRAAE